MGLNLGLGLGINSGGKAYTFLPQTRTLLNSLTGVYSLARKKQIDLMIRSLVTAGVWAKLDVLQVYAALNAADAVINWKSPGTFNATLVNSPTFEADRGATGDGASSYINSGYTPSLGSNWGQDSASFGIAINARNSSAAFEVSGARNTGWATTKTATYLRYATDFSGIIAGGVNSDVAASGSSTTPSNGLFTTNRIASDKVEFYKNNSKQITDLTITSTGETNQVLYVLAFRNESGTMVFPSNDRAAIMFAGAGMSGAEMTALSAALETYLDFIGAGVIA